MKAAGILLLITGILEAILGIPGLGGLIVLGTSWSILGVMLILHIITLVLCKQNNKPTAGSILGIVTSVLAWIPILGMIMHIASAVVILIGAAKKSNDTPPSPQSF